jgi:hypothetical protein
MDEIIYQSECQTCLDHKTDLGILAGLDKSVKTNFPDWLPEKQQDLVLMWYDKIKNKDMAMLIQGFKTGNIKAINK